MAKNFTSLLQVLKVDDVETKKGRDGNEFEIHTAQCALLSDDGVLEKVGALRIPEKMRETMKVGVYQASFALEVAGWGKNKCEVMAALVGLLPVTLKGAAKPA